MAEELERRRKAMQEMEGQEPSPDQGQQGKQPLVPPVAELLLIPTVSCALAFAAWEGAHTKVELLVQRFRPRLAGWSQGLMLLAGSGFWCVVLYAGIEEAIRRGASDVHVEPFDRHHAQNHRRDGS